MAAFRNIYTSLMLVIARVPVPNPNGHRIPILADRFPTPKIPSQFDLNREPRSVWSIHDRPILVGHKMGIPWPNIVGPSTRATDKELARQVSYLKAENQMLRSRLPDRISLTQSEKNRLVRFAKKLGSALNELATIVHPGTIRRWMRETADNHSARQKGRAGRPRTAEQIEKLVLKLAKDNGWGYTRILGEMKKLGIESVTRSTVKNILKRNGYDVGPKRGPGTWDEFLKRHAKTMWQCDFFSKKIVSKTGLRDIFVLVFLHVETRRVYISPSTYQPDEAWMLEQAEAFMQHARSERLPCEIVMHDNDCKFSKPFLQKLAGHKIKTQRTAMRSPNTVAFVERFVQTIKQECLDHFVVFGHQHMDVLSKEVPSVRSLKPTLKAASLLSAMRSRYSVALGAPAKH